MKVKTSILNEHLNLIFGCKDVETCRKIFLGIVEGSRVNDYSKSKMVIQAKECNTLIQLQQYAANSCMKFMGMGVR